MNDPFGYLFVHFMDGSGGESIHFSLSEGDDPLRWRPLHQGEPVLVSTVGTGGVRDPAIARDEHGRFHILATDLKVEGGAGDWDSWVRSGSRSLVIWDSSDLLDWSAPRLVTVAPAEAGMAWAPEVTLDPETGESIVFWSSRLYAGTDHGHAGDAYSRILFSRTRDFVEFSPAEIMIDTGRDIIDTAIHTEGALVHRISKDEDRGGDSRLVFHEIGRSLFADHFDVVATRIAAAAHRQSEAPILVKDPREQRWYLYLDQYDSLPQGYFVLESDDIATGSWTIVPSERTSIRPGTKHGGILRLERQEYERLNRL